MSTFLAEMGVMRWPLLVAGAFMCLQIARAAWRILRGGDGGAVPLHAVLIWGALCALLGVLGTVVGLSNAAAAIERAGAVSAGVVWGGVRVALTTTVAGFCLLTVAVTAWLALSFVRSRRSSGESPERTFA